MEWYSIVWNSIGKLHLIMKTLNNSDGLRLGRGVLYSSVGTNGIAFTRLVFHSSNASHYEDSEYFYSSIGTNGTNSCISRIEHQSNKGYSNGTNRTIGIALIRLVFYSWNASHYKDLECLQWLQAEERCILLVPWYKWYDWYQWNCSYSIGDPLVKCISSWRAKNIFQGIRVRRCPSYSSMELPSFDRYFIGEMHVTIKTYNIYDGSRLSRDAFYLSIGSNGTFSTNEIALIWLVFYS